MALLDRSPSVDILESHKAPMCVHTNRLQRAGQERKPQHDRSATHGNWSLSHRCLSVSLTYQQVFPIWNCLEPIQARNVAYCNSMRSTSCLARGDCLTFVPKSRYPEYVRLLKSAEKRRIWVLAHHRRASELRARGGLRNTSASCVTGVVKSDALRTRWTVLSQDGFVQHRMTPFVKRVAS